MWLHPVSFIFLCKKCLYQMFAIMNTSVFSCFKNTVGSVSREATFLKWILLICWRETTTVHLAMLASLCFLSYSVYHQVNFLCGFVHVFAWKLSKSQWSCGILNIILFFRLTRVDFQLVLLRNKFPWSLVQDQVTIWWVMCIGWLSSFGLLHWMVLYSIWYMASTRLITLVCLTSNKYYFFDGV